MKLSLESRIKDVIRNPIGHDVICRLLFQAGKSEKILSNPVVKNLKLKTVARFTKNMVGIDTYDAILKLLNTEKEIPESREPEREQVWWKESVIYQIYPRSFMDSNGDGIGDIRGIISKLDYLKDLGIGCIWLSPIYDSPNDDNGYDIRDYKKIMHEFGDMEDFDELLKEAHKRNMKLIMDLVVNHTSDEHKWFKSALAEPESKYRNYYIFRKGDGSKAPNNWTSFFSGSAWKYYDKEELWALHLFSSKQMDLNWDNEDVRNEICNMVRWWLDKGIDGFRMDVINYISKAKNLPDGDRSIGEMIGFTGMENYFYGPNLHRYLHELKVKAFEPYNAFCVGETPGVGREMAKLMTADYRKEIDMIFNFDHLETPGHMRFDIYDYDLNYYKQYIISWLENYGSNCWMSLFYENHDNPRVISKIEKDPEFRKPLGKLLGLIQMTLKGTPFIFQGQEIGAVNKEFTSIEDIRDIESINLYKELSLRDGAGAAFKRILAGSRDNARTPMQWSDEINGGFTKGTPWIKGDNDYEAYNVQDELKDTDSILVFYKKLIELRKKTSALIYGDIEFINKKTKNVFTYYRRDTESKETFYIECNLSNAEVRRPAVKNNELVISNYIERDQKYMKPYEASLYRV